jgi:putative colanic acid biosysnthesis UDP-glucose lipid carrier transferase
MFSQTWIPIHHHRSFMVLAGIASAVINAAPFAVLVLMQRLDESVMPYLNILLAVIALCAFVSFASFPLLISARSTSWMLSQGIVRWFRVPVALLVSIALLAHNIGGWLIESRSVLMNWGAIALPLQAVCLICLRRVAAIVNNAPGSRQRVVFIGHVDPEVRELSLRLQRSPILGIYVTGFYASEPPAATAKGSALPYLGNYADAVEHLLAGQFEMAILTQGIHDDKADIGQIVGQLYDSTASIFIMPTPPFLGQIQPKMTEIAGISLLAAHSTKILGLSRLLKRAMDLALSIVALAVLWPVMLAAAVAVKLDTPGPILFRQTRYGENGMPISVYKFRSMRVQTETGKEAVLRQATTNDDRVTRVGRILRRTSLDELPQLLNVLAGSMSMVGPRPHAAQHNELYRVQISGYMLRHSVKPGMTGWAQIHGLRGETDTLDKMERRIQYDRYYIMNWSLKLDVTILLRTLPAVLWQRDATY